MFIDDDELRGMYADSCAERLQEINNQVLLLERREGDWEREVEAILRELHSLKGDSRMLNLTTVEGLTHEIETLFVAIQGGKLELGTELFSVIFYALDSLRQVTQEPVTGVPSGVDVLSVVNGIKSLVGEETTQEDEIEFGAGLIGTTEEIDFLMMPESAETEAVGEIDFSIFNEEEAVAAADSFSVVEAASVSEADRGIAGMKQTGHSGLEPATLSESSNAGRNIIIPVDDGVPEESLAATGMSERIERTEKAEIINVIAAEAVEPVKAEKAGKAGSGELDFTIPGGSDSIRVSPERLDAISRWVGELIIDQQKLQKKLRMIEELQDLTESFLPYGGEEQQIILERFNGLHRALETDITHISSIVESLEGTVKNIQLLPFSVLFRVLPRTVRDISKVAGREVRLELVGEETLVDRQLLERVKSSIIQLIKNAIDHGIEPGHVRLRQGKAEQGTIIVRAYSENNRVIVEVSDDGRGIDPAIIGAKAVERGLITQEELGQLAPDKIIEFIYHSGFSTKVQATEISGRGVGLDLVKQEIDNLQGRLSIESIIGQGTKFRIELLSKSNIASFFITQVEESYYAYEIDHLQRIILFKVDELINAEDKLILLWEEQAIEVIFTEELFNAESKNVAKFYHCLIYKYGQRYVGIALPQILDYLDLQYTLTDDTIRSQHEYIKGLSILDNGQICHLVNVSKLCGEVRVGGRGENSQRIQQRLEAQQRKYKIMIVEDSMPIRTQLGRILRSAEYEVVLATNGLEGLELFKIQDFDLILSDVEMPQMNGIEMIKAIRATNKNLPVILLTTLEQEQAKRLGYESGADAYFTKGRFDQVELLQEVQRLLSRKQGVIIC